MNDLHMAERSRNINIHFERKVTQKKREITHTFIGRNTDMVEA